jgi:hypothetical protein
MEYIKFILMAAGVVILLMIIMPPPKDKDISLVNDEPNCPPHQWKWLEVEDNEGNKTHRMVCNKCGPMKKLEDRGNGF